MRFVFAAVLTLHGLIHLMGFVKAFGVAEMSQLTQPISRAQGLVWLLAAVLVVGAVVAFFVAPQWFWLVGVVALVVSQGILVTAWRDAKFGTVANVILLVGVALRFASHGPFSMWAEYRKEVRLGLAADASAPSTLREEDLRSLPEPVQKYLRVTGSVGQPRVHNFKVTMKGRIRGSASEPWMPFEVEQHSFYGPMPSRLFFMDATMKHLPVDVFHRFVGDAATFRARVLSAVTVVDAKGPEMNRSETVTLFNDLCIMAPAMLVDPSIQWEPVDATRARARYTRGSETIAAELKFNDAGELIDFISDDRAAASPDGTSFTQQRWTTPVRGYRAFGPRRMSTFGAARWEPKNGEAFTYGEFELQTIDYNVAGR